MTDDKKRVEEIRKDVIAGGWFGIQKTAINFLLDQIDKRDEALRICKNTIEHVSDRNRQVRALDAIAEALGEE